MRALTSTLLLAAAALPAASSAQDQGDPTITLRNASGMTVRLIPQGAAVTAIEVPDRDGKLADVVLGYATAAEYRTKMKNNFFGTTVGRYAGRIGNARFVLDGKPVQLEPNDGPNALHGGGKAGLEAFDWQVSQPRGSRDRVTFTTVSPDGFQGFPGQLTLTVTYRLAADNALHIDYTARTTRTTVLNLTNHSYFNLAGEASGSVLGQTLQLEADRYLPTDDRGIPTGALAQVAGTPLDFRQPHAIGERMANPVPPLTPRGYNHAWLFNKPAGRLAPVARLADPATGRTLTVETTEPSIQVYTGGYLNGTDIGPGGRAYGSGAGVALEVQHLPDSPNHASFPSTVLKPGQLYRQTTVWRFGVDRSKERATRR